MTKRSIRMLAMIGLLGSLVVTSARGQAILELIGSPTPLTASIDGYYQQPAWSPDGSQIAFTGEAYRGLWVATADGTNLVQLSDERAAGFGFSWSSDGQKIVTRVARYDGLRRWDAVKVFDVRSGSSASLTEYRRDLPALPIWSRDGGHVILSFRDNLEVLAADPGSAKAISSDPILVACDGRVAVADPVRGLLIDVPAALSGQPINLVRSPDGSRAAFEVYGGNMFVVSADGSPAIDLGPGNRPQWSPDGEWVVFMQTEDDGHSITSSDLFAVRADGSARVQLTDTNDALEMNPTWFPDGSRIAYDDGGTLFEISIEYSQ